MRRAGMIVFVLGAVMTISTIANACPSCYGDPSSSEVAGMKWAILSLLGVTGSVLVGMSALFLYLRKRAKEFNKLFNDRLN